MTTINIDEIQSDLIGCLQRLPFGETLLITQFGQPVAEIKPVAPAEIKKDRLPRPFGLAEGQFVVPDDFNDPLPEEILRDFEGR